MNKFNPTILLTRFGMPTVLIILGLILLLVPDVASILIANIMAWGLCAACVCYVIGAIMSAQQRISRIIWAAVCLIIGLMLLSNPLLLAENIGRFVGILTAIEGGSCLRKDNRVVGFLLFLVAMWLTILPLSLSRTMFFLCGLVVLICGVISLLFQLKEHLDSRNNF